MRHAMRAGGFSLVELMVAIALGLLILAGMLLVFSNSSATRNEIERNNRQVENGRYAMELLRDDVQLAGFYGEMNWGNFIAPSTVPSAPLPASMPDPCVTALPELTANATRGILRLHVQGVDNYAAGTLSCLTGANAVKPGTDVIVIRRVKTCVADAADCDAFNANKAYLQSPFCGTPPPPASTSRTHALALGADAATEFLHRLKNCTTAAPLRPYVNYIYFVGTDHVLRRAEHTGAGVGNVVSLVDGIENLQLEYGVDTLDLAASPLDGNADSYLSAAGINAVTAMPVPEVWSNVVSVRIHLLARNTESSPGYSDTKTYNLGAVTFTPNSANLIGPNNEPETRFRRHVYTSLVRITNVSARRETP